jgi:hypothetical protein
MQHQSCKEEFPALLGQHSLCFAQAEESSSLLHMLKKEEHMIYVSTTLRILVRDLES